MNKLIIEDLAEKQKMKMIVASRNKGKLLEIEQMFLGLPYVIQSMEQIGLNIDIEENGSTFEENALIKAREVCKLTGCIAIADDSGLEVEYLNGAPGIYSARFAGEGASDADRNAKLLEIMKDVPDEKRNAHFTCVIAVVFPWEQEIVTWGKLEGRLTREAIGVKGFGYDPILFIPEYGKTVAELSSELKNSISHRGKALRGMLSILAD